MVKISNRHIKAWEKFNAELEEFIYETEGHEGYVEALLYENANTFRSVRNFQMSPEGILTWTEENKPEREQMFDEDDAKDRLSFWKGCLRRAKRYWSMDAIELDRLQDSTTNNEEDEQ